MTFRIVFVANQEPCGTSSLQRSLVVGQRAKSFIKVVPEIHRVDHQPLVCLQLQSKILLAKFSGGTFPRILWSTVQKNNFHNKSLLSFLNYHADSPTIPLEIIRVNFVKLKTRATVNNSITYRCICNYHLPRQVPVLLHELADCMIIIELIKYELTHNQTSFHIFYVFTALRPRLHAAKLYL